MVGYWRCSVILLDDSTISLKPCTTTPDSTIDLPVLVDIHKTHFLPHPQVSTSFHKFPWNHEQSMNHQQGQRLSHGFPNSPSHSSRASSARAAADCSAAFLPLQVAPANLPASLPATSGAEARRAVSIPTWLVSCSL